MLLRRHLLVVSVACVLASCGGGGSAVAPAGGGGTTSGGNTGNSSGSNPRAAQAVQLNMHIPGASSSASAAKRSPQFVASSTEGVLVVVYATSDTAHTTPLGSSATDVSPGSSACGGASGPRTCSISIPAPAGTDDFVFTTYDQPPSNGTTFPSNAHLLATGVVKNQIISLASANVVNVTLSGAINSLTANPPAYSFAAGTGQHSYNVEVNAYDAGGNVIIGPYVDANGNPNPITVAVNPIGGFGYTTAAVGASTPGLTAIVNSSSDIATIAYNGNSPTGYWVNLNIASASGSVVTSSFNPLFVSSTSPYFTAGANATLAFTAAGQSATIGLFEENATTSSVDASGCTNVATVTQPGTGNTQSFTVTASSAGGSCTILITFAQATYAIAVSAPSNTTANVAVPGSLLAYTADGPTGVGIRNAAGTELGSIATTSSADNIALDDAGNVYVITQGSGILAKYTPSAGGYPPTYTKSSASYTLSNPSGVFAVQASGAGEIVAFELNAAGTQNIFDIWDAGRTGAPSRTITVADPTYFLTYGEELAHNGNFYYAQYVPCSSNASLSCIQYNVVPPGTATPSRTFGETIVAQASQSSFYPSYATIGPDGTLYQTVWDGSANGDANAGLYIYPPTGSERIVKNGANAPEGVDIDANGTLYIVNNNTTYSGSTTSADTDHLLYVLSADGGTILRTVNLFPDPLPIAVAADGTAFISSFDNVTNAPNETGGVFSLPAGGYSTTQIDTYGAYNVVLYDGSRETTSTARAPLAIGSGAAHAGGGMHQHR